MSNDYETSLNFQKFPNFWSKFNKVIDYDALKNVQTGYKLIFCSNVPVREEMGTCIDGDGNLDTTLSTLSIYDDGIFNTNSINLILVEDFNDETESELLGWSIQMSGNSDKEILVDNDDPLSVKCVFLVKHNSSTNKDFVLCYSRLSTPVKVHESITLPKGCKFIEVDEVIV